MLRQSHWHSASWAYSVNTTSWSPTQIYMVTCGHRPINWDQVLCVPRWCDIPTDFTWEIDFVGESEMYQCSQLQAGRCHDPICCTICPEYILPAAFVMWACLLFHFAMGKKTSSQTDTASNVSSAMRKLGNLGYIT